MMNLERVAGRLRASGHRITAQRRAVLRALAALGCAQDAWEIHTRARRFSPRLGLVTVYRTLQAFTTQGLAHPVFLGDGRTRYELTEHSRHHHHLVCLSCGSVAPFEECAVQPLEGALLGGGFEVTAHRLELFGYCRRCRPQMPTSARRTRARR